MYPTLNGYLYDEYGLEIEENVADSVYINRFAGFTRGDVGVFNNPSLSPINKHVVKRIIAVGGDKIAIGSITSLNNEPENVYKVFLIKKGSTTMEILNEPYLPSNMSLYSTYSDFKNYRLSNPTKFTAVNSEHGILYFLTLNDNEVFLLGDNREIGNSYDSADYGSVDANKYVGRVDIIAYQSSNNFSYIFLYYWHKLFGW